MSREDKKPFQNDRRFKEDKEKQLERDQKVMPIDELPLKEIKYEEEEQRDKNKEKTKRRSSTDKLT
ncbi:hypothetical protein HXA34_02595 [Salipaludibacillus agaradhaerens]|uniref:hypothetical protein n=1 Tax=Salipaludibacillus agaradhaerens TaxID=76935 RepID=UPI002151B86B|nr:hypothetical protein [Salipaludibacillus agaradhaerens]MCR6105175.1 hypothetical protein [Salipaludibacillus agaradhaerens]MCR6117220.1 hypothetical protein [Salipaludibacillus agaradhaerens]UJW56415.1 hypothetical protein HXZ66_02750 [Bacillus sp. A116_S68]